MSNQPITFKDLPVGASFDFVNDEPGAHNSFFARCTKISARRYSWAHHVSGILTASVGNVNVGVYHVAQP